VFGYLFEIEKKIEKFDWNEIWFDWKIWLKFWFDGKKFFLWENRLWDRVTKVGSKIGVLGMGKRMNVDRNKNNH